MSFFAELWSFLKEYKRYWLLPMILVVALLGILAVLAEGSKVAPFIYSVF